MDVDFKIDVQIVDDGWCVRVTDLASGAPLVDPGAGAPFPDRRLGCVGGQPGSAQAFPLPPAAEANALLACAPHRDLCLAADAQPLDDLYNRIVGAQPGESGMERFGRYLFTTLLGDALWAAIKAAAGGGHIALSLTWPAADRTLSRLPWEAMHGPDLFLAQEPRLAITRRVAGATSPAAEIPIEVPPRVLFVVGADTNSDLIRSGIEHMAVLWSLRHTHLGLRHHVLFQATPDTLKATVEWFRPTVVHFICHGMCADGACSLQLAGQSGSISLGAQELAELLRPRPDLALPPIVVLNICYIPTIEDRDLQQFGQVATPLATDLVQRGVALAVSLAGEATDQSCRLFTWRFYEALLHDGLVDIAHHAAAGRRAGLPNAAAERAAGQINHRDVYPWTTVDWSLSMVLMPEAPLKLRVTLSPEEQHCDWYGIAAREFALTPDYPAFCARLELFESYSLLMADKEFQEKSRQRKEIQVLAVAVDQEDNPITDRPRYGRTRLLQELAVKAVRDGHIPCLVTQDVAKSMGEPWPQEFPRLLDVIIQAANDTSVRFGLQPSSWQYVKGLREMAARNTTVLPEELRQVAELRNTYINSPNAPDVLAVAFRLDLLRFLDDIRFRGTNQPPAAPAAEEDEWSPLELGMDRLLERIARTDPRFLEVANQQSRLLDNLRWVRQNGDNENRRTERNAIIAQLNGLALAALRLTFNELSEPEAPRAQPEPSEGARGQRSRVLLLIDDLHQMGEAVAPLLNVLFSPRGIGSIRPHARAVFTYSSKPLVGQEAAVQAIANWRGRVLQDPNAKVTLEKFRQPTEERLAYEHFLLHWKNMKTGQKMRLTPARANADVEHFFQAMREEVEGIPSYLERRTVSSLIRYCLQTQVLQEADDEHALLQTE